MIRNKIKILIIYILWYIWIQLWLIIRFTKKQKKYDNQSFQEIIFNRSDRIWDAIISKNFIKLTINFLSKQKISSNFKILSSEYNSFIFKNDTSKNYNLEVINKNISDDYNIFSMLIKSLKFTFKNIFTSFSSKKEKLFIDLVWDPYTIKKYKHNSIIIWPNLFLNNFLLDYSLKYSYVSSKSLNLIESYINLIEWYFNFWWEFRKYIYKNIDIYIWEFNNNFNKKSILIFIWNKEFRNLSINKWKEIIDYISEKYKDYKIEVIDDNKNFLYKKIKNYNFNNNVRVGKNTLNLDEFRNYAKKFELLIWIDWGWFNFIRTIRNSITIYTLWNSKVWSIFSWENYYNSKKISKNHYICNTNINWKEYSYIYKESFFLPSYDISLWKKKNNDLPNNFIDYFINNKK